MRLLKAVLAGFFVMLVGVFTASVIAVSALVIFIGRRLRGDGAAVLKTRGAVMRRPAARRGPVGDVIDVDATEVRSSPSGN